MNKTLNVGDRIKVLREARGMSQVKFADLIGVTPPTISRWEAGEVIPPAEGCLRLGNLAPYPENLWFWQQAGIDPEMMLSTAGQILRERGAEPAPDEVVYVPRTSGTVQEGEEAGRPIPLPAEFVPNPLSIRCLVVDETLANSIFPVGDLILVDVSANNAEDLRPLWGQVVLVHLTRPKDLAGLRMAGFWKEGLNIGRLRCRTMQSGDRLHWVATLGPFDDAQVWYESDKRLTVVGSWAHDGPPKDPIRGSPREQAGQELEKVYARYERLREKARGRVRTLELDQAEEALTQARFSVSKLEQAEMREAEEEAKTKAASNIRLLKGCRILGRVIGWLRAPEERRAEKEKGK